MRHRQGTDLEPPKGLRSATGPLGRDAAREEPAPDEVEVVGVPLEAIMPHCAAAQDKARSPDRFECRDGGRQPLFDA